MHIEVCRSAPTKFLIKNPDAVFDANSIYFCKENTAPKVVLIPRQENSFGLRHTAVAPDWFTKWPLLVAQY